MGLLDRLNQAWSKADFWDKQENAKQQAQFDEEERKRREEEKRRQQIEQQRKQVTKTPAKISQEDSNGYRTAYELPKVTQEELDKRQVRRNTYQELEKLTDKNMDRALQEEKNRTSWFSRQFTDRNWDKRAEATARSRATVQYQDKNGWNADETVVNYAQGNKKIIDDAAKNSGSKLLAPVLSTARVGTGLVQGSAGLYDLLTPGKGTNRVSQAATKKAEEQDQLAKDLGIEGAYKTGNVVGELGSYFIPGAIGLKVANAFPKGTRLTSQVVNTLAKTVDNAGDANRLRQILANQMRRNMTLDEAIQEIMVTGRYMGQNTARGGDTSPASIATDVATSIGGTLLFPTRAIDKILHRGQVSGDPVDEALGGSMSIGAKSADEALQTPNKPKAPEIAPGAPEVAPGVKSPNLQQQAAATPPPVEPTPQQPIEPIVQPPQPPKPFEQPVTTPAAPQAIDPNIKKAIVEQQQQMAEQVATPPEPQPIPVAEPVKTPIVQQSERVPVTPVVQPGDVITPTNPVDNTWQAKREALLAEREAAAAEGLDTSDIDGELAALDNIIANEAAKPSPEAQALADGDKQLAEATSNVTKDHKQVKAPAKSKVTNGEVKTVTKPEISKPEAPSKPGAIKDYKDLADSARQYDSVVKWREAVKTNLIDENGRILIDKETGETVSAKEFFDRAKATAPTKVEPEGIDTDKLAKKVEANKQDDLANAYATPKTERTPGQRKLIRENEKAAPKTVATPVAEAAPAKPKTVEPIVETPKQPTHKQLVKGATENRNKDGTVSKRWQNAQTKAGVEAGALTRAVEAVQGPPIPKAPLKEKPVSTGGLPLSGGQGVGTGADTAGKVYEATSRGVNVEQGKRIVEARGEVRGLLDDIAERLMSAKGGDDALDVTHRNAAEQLRKKFEPGTDEYKMLTDVIGMVNQNAAQVLSTANRLFRSTASAEELMNHLMDRIARMTKSNLKQTDIDELKGINKRYIESRSKENKAMEAFDKDPSDENLKAYKDAQAARAKIDREQKLTELRAIANASTDKEHKEGLYKLFNKLSKEADIWQMDYIDTSLLSTSGTWVANFVNSSMGAIEEGLFGKVGAKVARGITKTDITSGTPLSLRSQRFAINKLRQDFRLRKQLPHKNVGGKYLNLVKNIVTTMNEIGNTQIEASAHAAARAEYERLLKQEYPDKYGGKLDDATKKELSRIADYQVLRDPRDLMQKYIDDGYKVQGMAAVIGKAQKTNAAKFENWMSSSISSAIRTNSGQKVPKGVADGIGKLSTRVLFGFPTIVIRSAGQGLRRTSLGTFTGLVQAPLTKDPIERAMLIKQAVKEAGSGASLMGLGFMLGTSGHFEMTGAYPTDKTEKKEWEKEGKTPWSIKIGDDYHNLPRLLGPFAIPVLVGTMVGQSSRSEGKSVLESLRDNLAGAIGSAYDATMPMDQISDNFNATSELLDIASTDEDKSKRAGEAFVKFGGNAARVSIPVSGALNQIAQTFTPNVKDPKQYDNPVEGVINYVMAGIPVLNHKLPDKKTEDGFTIKNTDPLARAFGAKSTVNEAGVIDNAAKEQMNNDKLSPVVNDKEVYNLLDKETQTLIDDALDPKKSVRLNDENYKKIYNGIKKTSDKLASEGKWASYGNTLKVKLSTQEADATVTKEEKELTQREITRADVLEKNKDKPWASAKIYSLYTLSAEKGGISDSDFKKMIDEESEYYDFETATALWELDKALTAAGVSGNTTGAIDPWTRQKYSMPEEKKGKKGGSGSGGSKTTSDFGTIGSFGRLEGSTQKYQKLQNPGSPIPNLTASAAKTNLRKKISVAKGVRL